MLKVHRARVILGQILSLDRTYGQDSQAGATQSGIKRRQIRTDARWLATLQLHNGNPNGLAGKDVPFEHWDQLHIEVGGSLKLALRFHGDRVHIIVFEPGPWEVWFDTFNPTDQEIIRP